MDRHFAAIQRSQLLLIVVHHDHVVAQVGKTSPRHQPYISRTNHRNPHQTLLPRRSTARMITKPFTLPANISPAHANEVNKLLPYSFRETRAQGPLLTSPARIS